MNPVIADAINAYTNAATQIGSGMSPREGDGGEFADLVADAARSAIAAGHKAESMTIAAVEGKAELAEVVVAVNNAELTLQAVVAIRDRMIQAYQDIIRMPI